MLEFLVLFFAVYFWGSPIGLSSFLGHCGVVILSLSSLRNISKSYLFWIILLLTVLSAQEIRFSLEYILLATTFFYIGKDKLWDGDEKENKRRQKRQAPGSYFYTGSPAPHLKRSGRGA